MAPLYMNVLCINREKRVNRKNVQFYGQIYAILLRIDTPSLHDEVAYNYQSAAPSSTRNVHEVLRGRPQHSPGRHGEQERQLVTV